MKKEEIQQLKNVEQHKIHEAEAYLQSTDYIALKIAEGAATKQEYYEKIELRQECRDNINAAKARIAELDAIVPEDDETMEG